MFHCLVFISLFFITISGKAGVGDDLPPENLNGTDCEKILSKALVKQTSNILSFEIYFSINKISAMDERLFQDVRHMDPQEQAELRAERKKLSKALTSQLRAEKEKSIPSLLKTIFSNRAEFRKRRICLEQLTELREVFPAEFNKAAEEVAEHLEIAYSMAVKDLLKEKKGSSVTALNTTAFQGLKMNTSDQIAYLDLLQFIGNSEIKNAQVQSKLFHILRRTIADIRKFEDEDFLDSALRKTFDALVKCGAQDSIPIFSELLEEILKNPLHREDKIIGFILQVVNEHGLNARPLAGKIAKIYRLRILPRFKKSSEELFEEGNRLSMLRILTFLNTHIHSEPSLIADIIHEQLQLSGDKPLNKKSWRWLDICADLILRSSEKEMVSHEDFQLFYDAIRKVTADANRYGPLEDWGSMNRLETTDNPHALLRYLLFVPLRIEKSAFFLDPIIEEIANTPHLRLAFPIAKQILKRSQELGFHSQQNTQD